MGIFDLFSSGQGIRAAKTGASDILKSISGAGTQLGSSIGQATGTEQQALKDAIAALMGGQGQAAGAIQGGMAPWQTIASESGGFLPLYAGALGAGTPQENAAAKGAFQASPGYQYTLGQGLEGLSRVGQSTGQLGEANMDAMKYAQNLSDQDYQQWLNNLFQGVGVNTQAAGGIQSGQDLLGQLFGNTGLDIAKMTEATGGAVGGMQADLGTQLADLLLKKGQTGANLQQQIFGAKQGAASNSLNALFGIGQLLTNMIPGAGSGGITNLFSPSTGTGAFDSMMQGSGFMDNAGNIY